MTACSSELSHLTLKDESAWGENVSSMTSAMAVPILGPVDMSSIRQSMIDSQRTGQHRNAGFQGIVGPWANAEFSFRIYLKGFESSPAGSGLALTDHHNLVAWFIGAAQLSAAAGDTASGTGGAAHLATTTGASGFAAGSLGRPGTLGDGRGNGQWFVVGSHSSNTLTMLNALDGATNSGDVLYSAATISTVETSCAVTSKRALIQSADLQILAHGCFPKSYSFEGGAPGEALIMTCVVGVSWAEPVEATFPNTTLPATTNPAPAGGGSLFLADVGTTTRTALTLRQFGVAVTAGIVPVMGYAGVNRYQTIVGAFRKSDQITVSATFDGEGADATPRWWDAWGTNTPQHLLMSYSTAPGTALACYFPRLIWMGDRPVQNDLNGRNSVSAQWRAHTGLTTTTDLTLSAMRWGMG